MEIYTVHQAKAQLSKLIAKVCAGEEVILVQGGQPVARLVPAALSKKVRTPGRLKGKIRLLRGFDKPLSLKELKLWGLK